MATTLGCSLNTPKTAKSCCTPTKPSSNPVSVSKVRVIVRVRPFLPHEISARNGDPVSCISVLDRDFESAEDEVAVYLKDPQTRSEKISIFFFFQFFGQRNLWYLVLMIWGFLLFFMMLAERSATSWIHSLGKKITMWVRYSAEK